MLVSPTYPQLREFCVVAVRFSGQWDQSLHINTGFMKSRLLYPAHCLHIRLLAPSLSLMTQMLDLELISTLAFSPARGRISLTPYLATPLRCHECELRRGQRCASEDMPRGSVQSFDVHGHPQQSPVPLASPKDLNHEKRCMTFKSDEAEM